jgi:hypothetical protein
VTGETADRGQDLDEGDVIPDLLHRLEDYALPGVKSGWVMNSRKRSLAAVNRSRRPLLGAWRNYALCASWRVIFITVDGRAKVALLGLAEAALFFDAS